MALRFVLDENLRGPLWNLVCRYNHSNPHPIDVVRVGDGMTVSLGASDRELLRWAETEGRIVVSSDRRTMSIHLSDHLAAGHHSPGIMIIRAGTSLRAILEYLVLASVASEASEWADVHRFVP